MIRRHDWKARLADALAEFERTEFEWGYDCATGLATRAIEAQTGIDLGAEWRGTYSTVRGALKTLRSLGFDNVADLAAHHLREIHPVFAQYGDIAAIEADQTGWALGVFAGHGEIIAAFSPNGLGHVPRSAAKRAFAIT